MKANLVVTLTVEELSSIIESHLKKSFEEYYPKPPEKYLTPKQTCDLLGISRPTLTTYTQAGKLKDYRIGRKVLYKLDEVEQAMLTLKRYKPFVSA